MRRISRTLLATAVLSFFSILIYSGAVLGAEACFACHINLEEDGLRAPAEEISLGTHRILKCEFCHYFDLELDEEDSYLQDHRYVPRTLSQKQNIDACALRCHKNTIPFKHGKGVSVEDDLPISCTGCHETHATKNTSSRDSWIHRYNLPETCAGRGLECHDSEATAKKYGILNAYQGYLNSGHGRMRTLGYEKGAVCVDCHAPDGTPHTSIVEKEDKNSPINPDNREDTCTQKGCHAGGGLNVGRGSMHGRSEYQILGVGIERLIDGFYILAIMTFVGGAVLFIVLDFTKRKRG